ncbi:MAG: HD domain-containing protein [Candidatus Gracilibacteria bacterium]|nr:HD domain-containing protein [Candidatus Gracilibacteria bacterium]
MNVNLLNNAKKYVNKLLFPLENHYYHSYGHAIDVMTRAIYLAEKEGLNESDTEILALSALFHDTGFVIQYDHNEVFGARIAKNYLKSILYPDDKIKLIESIIFATDPAYTTPKNYYEEIIKDADMDNLGRDDFLQKNNDIKREIEIVKNIKIKDPDWKHASIELLKEFKYKTNSQKYERDKKKIENLKKMINELDEDLTL